MIIAIDETGDFNPDTKNRSFFVAAHIRQRKTLYKMKQRQFFQWENSLPKSLKNQKGEIKSSLLSDEQLTEFARYILREHFFIGITPYCISPSLNHISVIKKHRKINLMGILEGAKELKEEHRDYDARIYDEFGNWFTNLSDAQYLKILVLGACITKALANTVWHAITNRFEDELLRIKYLIDKDFIKEPRHDIFWHELLRNQLYNFSKTTPLPLNEKWKTKGHPFLDKYRKNGRLNFNELFWKQCAFVSSHEYFEIRIADAAITIISRYHNKGECREPYWVVQNCFLRDKKITEMKLKDVNLDDYQYDPTDNPWRSLRNNPQLT
jgi:hypothetical protein